MSGSPVLNSPLHRCRGKFAKVGTSRVDTFPYIYVTHAGTGEIRIFRGSDYARIGSVKLLEDADSIGYDPDKTPCVTHGGGGAHLEYALASGFRKKCERSEPGPKGGRTLVL